MATNAFETIRLNAAGEEKSYQWYRQQISSLGKLTNTWVWNLGVGASSLDTVFRLLDFWIVKQFEIIFIKINLF